MRLRCLKKLKNGPMFMIIEKQLDGAEMGHKIHKLIDSIGERFLLIVIAEHYGHFDAIWLIVKAPHILQVERDLLICEIHLITLDPYIF